jgi:acetyl-CoA carboxylase carboxyltransferase component
VLGREVYASNNQLGGTQIMHNNGVSHAIADNDYGGVTTMLRWLSYMPLVSFRDEILQTLHMFGCLHDWK